MAIQRRTASVVAVAVAAALAVLSALVAVGWRPLQSADAHAEDDVHAFVVAHHSAQTWARWLTHLGDPLVVTMATFAVAAALVVARRRRAAIYVLAVRAVAAIASPLLKSLVDRPRPVFVDVFVHPHGQSYPSGHALGSAALWASIAVVLLPRLGRTGAALLAVVPPAVVAVTRVALGVHFVSDVVAGLLFGWAIALGLARVLEPDRGTSEARSGTGSASP